jgi:small GTP-binding protein
MFRTQLFDTSKPFIKIVLLGDNACGKTSIIRQLVQETFSAEYTPSLGVQVYEIRLPITGTLIVKVQIWDCGAESISSLMLKSYLFNAQLVMLVYDTSNMDTFRDLDVWNKAVQKSFTGHSMKTVWVGNKSDLCTLSPHREAENERFSVMQSGEHCLVSAKSRESVTNLFVKYIAQLMRIKEGIRTTENVMVSHHTVNSGLNNVAVDLNICCRKRTR